MYGGTIIKMLCRHAITVGLLVGIKTAKIRIKDVNKKRQTLVMVAATADNALPPMIGKLFPTYWTNVVSLSGGIGRTVRVTIGMSFDVPQRVA